MNYQTFENALKTGYSSSTFTEDDLYKVYSDLLMRSQAHLEFGQLPLTSRIGQCVIANVENLTPWLT